MPASPLCAERNREPWAIPAGILVLIRLVFSARPSPLQTSHGCSITSPSPRQRGEVCETWKNPRELTTLPPTRQGSGGELLKVGKSRGTGPPARDRDKSGR